MKKNILTLIIFFMVTLLQSQSFYKTTFALNDEIDPFATSLYGNGIVDLLVQDSVLWAATGYGLSRGIFNEQMQAWEWRSFNEKDYLGKGGVSAMALMQDSILWIATAFDTTAQDEDLPAGGGLSYTKDGGVNWVHFSQPVDSLNEMNYAPTTTNVQNLTYDIAIIEETVWIASFGGGLRRSNDMGETWRVVTTDSSFFSSSANLNHRAFSLLSVEDTLWVGTAEGISKTIDNGISWERYRFSSNDSSTISGNFVVALAYQEDTQTIWASTIQAVENEEYRAVSKSQDWGKSWTRLLVDEYVFAHNFAFADNRVYVPTDQGLFYSNNAGLDWEEPILQIEDTDSGNEILQEEYYSAAVQEILGADFVWLGSVDGLAKTEVTDNLASADWDIVRSFVSTSIRQKPAVYAYPSPFSPSRHYYIRFEFGTEKILDEPIKIYDFALDEVATIHSGNLKPKWDGTNSAGDVVASGVYFFRAKLAGKVTWGKIAVIN